MRAKGIHVLFLLLILMVICIQNGKNIEAGEKKETNSFSMSVETLGTCNFEVIKEPIQELEGEVSLVKCDGSQATDIVVPSEIVYNGASYNVTTLNVTSQKEFPKAETVTIPDSITNYIEFACDFVMLKKVFMKCSYSAVKNNQASYNESDVGANKKKLPILIRKENADVVFYVPQNDVKKFKKMAKYTEVYCDLYMGDDEYQMVYCDPAVVALGTPDESVESTYLYENGFLYKATGKDVAELIAIHEAPEVEDYMYEIPETVKNVVGKEYRITSIGFMGAVGLDGVVKCSGNIKKIASGAFGEDTAGILFPNHMSKLPKKIFCEDTGDLAYVSSYEESALAYIKLPYSLKKLDKTFSQCKRLKGMVVPKKVKKVEKNAFSSATEVLYFAGKVPKGLAQSLGKTKSVTCYVKNKYVKKYKKVLKSLGKKVQVKACSFKNIHDIDITPETQTLKMKEKTVKKNGENMVIEISPKKKFVIETYKQKNVQEWLSYTVAHGGVSLDKKFTLVQSGKRIFVQARRFYWSGQFRFFVFDILSGKYDWGTVEVKRE